MAPDAEARVVADDASDPVDVDPHTAIFADPSGVIRAWGTAWVDAFGYRPEEALGQSLDLIVPTELRPLHWRGFTRAMRTGRLKRPGATLRVPAARKDGSIIPVRFVGGTIVFTEDNSVAGIRLDFVRRDPAWVGFLYRLLLRLVGGVESIVGRVRRSRAS